jgi:hypothetical protein
MIPQADDKVRCDVHVVWQSDGVQSSDLAAGVSKDSDAPSGTTRLVFKSVELPQVAAAPPELRWTSEKFGLKCTPGTSHQFVTAYLTYPGEELSKAIADHTGLIKSKHAHLSSFMKFIHKLIG